jgi:hypothetical protein
MALITIRTTDGRSVLIHSSQIGPTPLATVVRDTLDWIDVWSRFDARAGAVDVYHQRQDRS